MSTAPWAIKLKALQDKDMRIRQINLKLDMIPKEKLSLKNQAAQNLAKVEKVKNDVIELQLKLKKTENKITELKEAIRKLETQSAMVKKNNEYQAMLQSIEDHKLKIGDLEACGIELLDLIDNGKKLYRETAENVKFENACLKSEFKDLETLANDLKNEVEELQKQRNSLAEPIDNEILKRYENLLKRGDGEPLVKIIDSICSHCHLKITPQTLNQAVKKAVVFCDNCQHFIYTEE